MRKINVILNNTSKLTFLQRCVDSTQHFKNRQYYILKAFVLNMLCLYSLASNTLDSLSNASFCMHENAVASLCPCQLSLHKSDAQQAKSKYLPEAE